MAVQEQIYRSSGQAPSPTPAPLASPDVFGSGIGAALSGAGNELEHAARAMKQRELQVDASAAGVEAAQAGLDVDTAVQDIRQRAGPGAAGHVEAVIQAVDDRFAAALSKISNPKLRDHFGLEYAQQRARIVANEDGWSRGVRVEYQGANIKKTADLLGNRVQGDPDDGTFHDALTTLGTTIGTQGMSADLTEKLYRDGAQTIAVSRGRGMIEVDPAAALIEIAHGSLDEWITPEQKAALIDKAQVGVQAAAVELRRRQATSNAEARGYLEVLGKRFADNDPTITDAELERGQQLATVLKEEGKAYDVAKWRVWKQVDTVYRDASALQVSNEIHALDAKIRKGGGATVALPLDGLKQAGNIDIHARPVVHNNDGSISTVRTISIGTDQGEVLIPTVIDGKVVGNDAAIAHYRKTGEQLGIFDTASHATAYATALHAQQAAEYDPNRATADDVVRRDRLQSMLERKQRLEQSDPLTSSGVALAPLNPGDIGSIQARASAATAAGQQTGHYAFLTPPEVSQFKEEIASGPAGRLATINFLANVAQVDPQAALRAAAQIDPNDRTLRHAMRVGPAVREMVVRGTVARQSLPARVIGPDGNVSSIDNLSETWFADNVSPALVRSQPEFANDVLDTARAIYADWRRRSGTAGQDEEFHADQFGQAVNLALGGGGGRGGVGSWRPGPRRAAGGAYPFVLPSRFTENEFERRLANPIAVAGIHKAPNGSVNGTPVWANGKALGLNELRQKFVPVAIKDGIYQFHSGGRVMMTAPEPGRPSRPFQIDVRRIPPAAPAAHQADPRDHLGPGAAMQPGVPVLPSHPEVRGPVYFTPGGAD